VIWIMFLSELYEREALELLKNNETDAKELLLLQRSTARQLLIENEIKADVLKTKYIVRGENNVLGHRTAAKLLKNNEHTAAELLENNETDAKELLLLQQGMERALLEKVHNEALKTDGDYSV